jgi:hypothetical protein
MSASKPHLAAPIVLALAAAGAGSVLQAQPGRAEKTAPPPRQAPGDSWVLFLSRRIGENILYQMRPDGTGVKPVFGGKVREEELPVVTPGVALHRDPHWSRLSPDRTLFLSWVRNEDRPGGPGVRSRFMLYAGRVADGRALVVAPDNRDELFAWAPDSRRFAYAEQSGAGGADGLGSEDVTSRVFTANANGTAAKMVLERKGTWCVRDWSGDGKRLLLGMRKANAPLQELEWRLYELDLAEVLKGGKWNDAALTELLPPDPPRAANPKEVAAGAVRWFGNSARYAPDAKRVAMVVWRPEEKVDLATFDDAPFEKRLARFDRETVLAVYEVATRKLHTAARYPDGLRGPICWSPDGSEILFSRKLKAEDRREKTDPDERGLGIWAIRPDGTGERFLTTGWCPDWR